MTQSVIDTLPHPSLRVYSDGNLGEVAPDRLSPMAWSAIGPPMEQGFRSLASRLGLPPLLTSGSRYVYVGYFGCKPYHNLSALDLWASLVPGVDPDVLRRTYFRDALPAGPAPRGPTPSLLARVRTASAMVSLLLDALGSLPGAIEIAVGSPATKSNTSGTAADAFAVGCELRAIRDRLETLWQAHVLASTGPVIVASLQGALARRLIPGWEQLEPLLAEKTCSPWDVASVAGLTQGRSFGNVYEVTRRSPPWTVDKAPDGDLRPALQPRAAGPGAGASPLDALRDIHGRAGSVLARSVALLAAVQSLREGTKLAISFALEQLAERLPDAARARSVPDELWPMATIDELLRTNVPIDPSVLERRMNAVTDALGRSFPNVLVHDASGPRPAQPRRADTQGVSPGRATGLAVRPTSPDLGRDGRHILFCDRVDVETQALLPLVDGVVASHGSDASHVAIIARSLSIPAVVGYEGAAKVPDGVVVTIDGSTGEVVFHAE